MPSRKIGPDVGFRQPGQVGNEAAVTNRLRVGTRSSTFTFSQYAFSAAFPFAQSRARVATDAARPDAGDSFAQ